MIAKADLSIPDELVEAIRGFPTRRRVEHCEQVFEVSPLDMYFACPACGARLKLRAFSAVPEVEDVFDAVLGWMNQPGVGESVERRRRELIED